MPKVKIRKLLRADESSNSLKPAIAKQLIQSAPLSIDPSTFQANVALFCEHIIANENADGELETEIRNDTDIEELSSKLFQMALAIIEIKKRQPPVTLDEVKQGLQAGTPGDHFSKLRDQLINFNGLFDVDEHGTTRKKALIDVIANTVLGIPAPKVVVKPTPAVESKLDELDATLMASLPGSPKEKAVAAEAPLTPAESQIIAYVIQRIPDLDPEKKNNLIKFLKEKFKIDATPTQIGQTNFHFSQTRPLTVRKDEYDLAKYLSSHFYKVFGGRPGIEYSIIQALILNLRQEKAQNKTEEKAPLKPLSPKPEVKLASATPKPPTATPGRQRASTGGGFISHNAEVQKILARSKDKLNVGTEKPLDAIMDTIKGAKHRKNVIENLQVIGVEIDRPTAGRLLTENLLNQLVEENKENPSAKQLQIEIFLREQWGRIIDHFSVIDTKIKARFDEFKEKIKSLEFGAALEIIKNPKLDEKKEKSLEVKLPLQRLILEAYDTERSFLSNMSELVKQKRLDVASLNLNDQRKESEQFIFDFLMLPFKDLGKNPTSPLNIIPTLKDLNAQVLSEKLASKGFNESYKKISEATENFQTLQYFKELYDHLGKTGALDLYYFMTRGDINNTVAAYLIQPFQRLGKYSLLLEGMIKDLKKNNAEKSAALLTTTNTRIMEMGARANEAGKTPKKLSCEKFAKYVLAEIQARHKAFEPSIESGDLFALYQAIPSDSPYKKHIQYFVKGVFRTKEKPDVDIDKDMAFINEELEKEKLKALSKASSTPAAQPETKLPPPKAEPAKAPPVASSKDLTKEEVKDIANHLIALSKDYSAGIVGGHEQHINSLLTHESLNKHIKEIIEKNGEFKDEHGKLKSESLAKFLFSLFQMTDRGFCCGGFVFCYFYSYIKYYWI